MENELSSMADYCFKVDEVITKVKLYEFCDGRYYFVRLQKFLCEFVQKDQTSGGQHAVGRLNIFKSTLDTCKDVNPVATFQNMMLAWEKVTHLY